MKVRSILFLALSGLCVACGNMRTFQVETFNPADVTYPKEVSKILMVNNAVPQPDSVGYQFVLNGEEQDTCRAKADSALFAFCRSLGTVIADASYFEDVLLYHEPLRHDRAYLQDIRLGQEDVRRLCEENGTDAVISLERMTFTMEKEVESYPHMGLEYGVVKVRASGIVRTYIPQKEQSMATILLSDSVMWEEVGDNLAMLNELLPPPDVALEVAAAYIGARMSDHFVPHWSEASRWYYTNPGARWKEASAFASDGKWAEAEQRWMQIAEKSSNPAAQAKAYTNLALACEMQNRFSDACDWARKAEALFEKAEGEKGENTLLLKAYVIALNERISADEKLNIQIGE